MIHTRSTLRYVRYTIMCVLSLLACTTSRINGPGAHETVQVPRTGVLHIHATYTPAYCGGADPGPDGMPRPHPWRGAMYLRSCSADSTGLFAVNELDIPIRDTIRTNGTGDGWLSLPAGTYLLLDAERVDGTKHDELLRKHAEPAMYTSPIDTACMRRWLYGPFGVITIRSSDTVHVELPFFGKCSWDDIPCVTYSGPLPP